MRARITLTATAPLVAFLLCFMRQTLPYFISDDQLPQVGASPVLLLQFKVAAQESLKREIRRLARRRPQPRSSTGACTGKGLDLVAGVVRFRHAITWGESRGEPDPIDAL